MIKIVHHTKKGQMTNRTQCAKLRGKSDISGSATLLASKTRINLLDIFFENGTIHLVTVVIIHLHIIYYTSFPFVWHCQMTSCNSNLSH